MNNLIVPSQTLDCRPPCRGRLNKKPWQYDITVAIPHIGLTDTLERVIKLLCLQSNVSCYFLIVDTGSIPWEIQQIEKLRSDNVEIHYIKSHGFQHSSECVGAAMDLAFTLCRTPYMYCTHSDCFVMRRDWLSHLKSQCGPQNPVIGYQMSDRSFATKDWEWMVSHTSTMLYMPIMLSNGITWSFQRHRTFELQLDTDSWPDTETTFNWSLKQCGIKPELLGPELNWKRQTDCNIDHVRSFTIHKIYNAVPRGYREKIDGLMEQALRDADERIEAWKQDPA